MQQQSSLYAALIPQLGKATKLTLNCAQHGEYPGMRTQIGEKLVDSMCPECAKQPSHDDRLRNEAMRQMKQRQLEKRFGCSGIPPRFQGRQFSGFEPLPHVADALTEAKSYATAFAEHEKSGRGMLLIGPPGTGKTHLAAAIGQRVIGAGCSVLMISAADLISSVKETYRRDAPKSERQVIAEYADPDLLIVDEVGDKTTTEGERVILSRVIDRRYAQLRPIVMTTNRDLKDMEDALGMAAVDRVREVCQVVVCDGESYRKRANG